MGNGRPLNILIVSPAFYPEGAGGEDDFYNVGQRLAALGHRVSVLCGTRLRRTSVEQMDGLRVHRLRPDFLLASAPVKLNLLWHIGGLLRREAFDLIELNLHLPYFPDIAALAGARRHIPLTLTYHNDLFFDSPLKGMVVKLYNHLWLKPLTLRLARRIIVRSPYCYHGSPWLRKFRDKLVWIPPGLNLEKYHQGTSRLAHQTHHLPPTAPVILFVGRMDRVQRYKGVSYLLHAFAAVSAQASDAYLVLVGKGDMIPQFQAEARSLGMEQRVVFTGFLPEEHLIEYHRSARFLVLPSTTVQEGFGRVLVEANACGKPVIGSRVGGIPYVIRDGENGLLVPPKDPQALAGAMLRLLQDDELVRNMAPKARQIAEQYSWERTARETEQVYQEVVAR